MKISEVTSQARITRSTGNEVEIDHGDGTTTSIDTKKNPDAISRDEKGNVQLNKKVGNSSMTSQQKQRAQAPRPGERVAIDDED